MSRSNDRTGGGGAAIVETIVNLDMQWIYRPLERPNTDYGVDAHIEVTNEVGVETGRQIGAQVKAGPTYFEEPTEVGFVIRPSGRHVRYWSDYALPVLIALVDITTREVYWEFTDRAMQTPSGGWKLVVPRAQTLGAHAKEVLAEAAVGGGSARVQVRIEERRLSEVLRARVEELEDVLAKYAAQLAPLPPSPSSAVCVDQFDVLELSFPELIAWFEGTDFVSAGAALKSRTAYHLAAEKLFFREVIEEYDAAKAVALLLIANEWGKAGSILLHSIELARRSRKVGSPSIVDVLEGSPLPRGIALDLRIMIRSTQIAARQRQARPVEMLLEELDMLIAEATPSDAVAVMIAAFRETRNSGRTVPSRAIRYVKAAARLRPTATAPDGGPFPVDLDETWPLLIELTARGVCSIEEILAWLGALGVIPPASARSYLEDELAVMPFANSFWLAEALLPPESRRWPEVAEKLEMIEDWSVKHSAGLLYAAVRRARAIIKGEYEHNLAASIALTTNVPAFVLEHPKAAFLLSEIEASQFLYAGSYHEALISFRAAFDIQPQDSSLQPMAYLKAAQAAATVHEFDQAACWAQLAEEFAKANRDSASNDVVVSQAEHALTLWFGEKRDLALDLWDAAAEELFAQEHDSAQWRGCAVRFHWASGYLATMLRTGVAPETDARGNPYSEPRPGAFLIDFHRQAEEFDERLRMGIFLGLAAISDGRQRDARTRRWGYAALDVATKLTTEDRAACALFALPYLIADLRFDEAVSLTKEMVPAWEASVLRSLSDARVVALSFDVVPAILSLAQLDPDARETNAEQLVRAISAEIDNPTVAACCAIIEATFLTEATSDPERRTVLNAIRESNLTASESPVRLLCDLCESVLPGVPVNVSLALQATAVPQLTYRLALYQTMFRLHVAPFFRNAWLRLIDAVPEEFTQPEELRASLLSLGDSMTTPKDVLLFAARHIRKA
ncbi:MAG: DUF4365 domain-containing protein [Thermoanaerobaculia bacterium]|jgi:hypothetical protein